MNLAWLLGGELAVIDFVRRHPVRHGGGHELAAELLAGQPDDLQRRQEHLRIILQWPTDERRGLRRAGAAAQRPDGGFAMVVEPVEDLVDDFGFVFLAGPGVTPAQFVQDFGFRWVAHF